MKVLFINLEREATRRAFQTEQAERLGLDLQRIPAVTRDQVEPPHDADYWKHWQRPLRPAEMATLLSHRAAWLEVLRHARPCLILEDDAWLMPSCPAFLADAASLADVDHLSLETRNRFKLLGPPHPSHPGIRRLILDRTGAAAYVLWPEGARKLLARIGSVPGLADAVLMETPGLRSWQADPAQAIQVDMAANYGLVPPIAVTSAISDTARPDRGNICFRLRRMKENLRLSTRMFRLAFGAERRKVPLARPGTE